MCVTKIFKKTLEEVVPSLWFKWPANKGNIKNTYVFNYFSFFWKVDGISSTNMDFFNRIIFINLVLDPDPFNLDQQH